MAIPREPDEMLANSNSDGLRRDYTPAPQVTLAYLLGALHDATERKTTFRLGSDNLNYCKFLQRGIKNLGFNAWIYQEGKNRNYWIVEFSKNLLSNVKINSKKEKIDYIRGYFDTDGAVAKKLSVRYYLYFSQKDYNDLKRVKLYLKQLGIRSGKMHNPSKRVDPNYWRFYISAKSYDDFARIVNTAHPVKRKFLRMKI